MKENKNNLSKKFTIRFTESEISELKKKAAERKMKLSEYGRLVLSEKEPVNVEKNKTLISFANNFQRISNFMKMGIFNEVEKERLLYEIKILIVELREKIKW